ASMDGSAAMRTSEVAHREWRHPTLAGLLRLGRTRVGRQDLAAADATPEPPHLTNALGSESSMSAMQRLLQRLENTRLALLAQVQRCSVKANGTLHHLRQQRWRPCPKAIPPTAQRRSRQIEPSRQCAQLYVSGGAQRQHLANRGNLVQPSKEQKIRQQRVTRSARPTTCASNPDATLVDRIPHPAPIATPPPKPPTTARAFRHRRRHPLTSRHVLGDRSCPRPNDQHGGPPGYPTPPD